MRPLDQLVYNNENLFEYKNSFMVYTYFCTGRLHDPFRGLYLPRDEDQVHDGGHVAARMSRGSRHDPVLDHHVGRGPRAHCTDGRIVWLAQRCKSLI